MPSIARKIAYVSLLTALGIVLNFFSWSLPFFGRASFVYFFCTFAGIVVGPWLGFASAFMADLIPAIIWPQDGLPPMLLITLSQGCMALIPGLIFHYVKWKSFTLKLIVSAVLSFFICTLGIGAAGSIPLLEAYYKTAMRWGQQLGINSPYLMIVLYKGATQPFWIALNAGLTAAVYKPIEIYLSRHTESLRKPKETVAPSQD